MKKVIWLIVVAIACGSLFAVGCKSDDVTKDSLVGAEVPKIEDLKHDEGR